MRRLVDFDRVAVVVRGFVGVGIAALLSLPALGLGPAPGTEEGRISGPVCRERSALASGRVLILRIPPEPDVSGSARTPAAPEVAGVVVFRDPVTGRFRKPATPEEAQEIRRQIQAAARFRPPPREVPMEGPAGGIGVRLQGRFHNALTVRKDATGRLVFDCTDPGPPEADRASSAEGR